MNDDAQQHDPHGQAGKVFVEGTSGPFRGPTPKYETPQVELEEVPTTDPGAAHLDPKVIADKPV